MRGAVSGRARLTRRKSPQGRALDRFQHAVSAGRMRVPRGQG